MKSKYINTSLKYLLYLIIVICALPLVLPLIWMILTSITPESHFFNQENLIYFPSKIRVQNFIDALKILPFHKFFINTITYSILATFGTLLSCTFVAYGFARYKFKNRSLVFGVLISTMLLPWVVLMVPMFLIFNFFGLIDTYYPLTLPTFFGLSAGTVFILRQRIRTIPNILFDIGNI